MIEPRPEDFIESLAGVAEQIGVAAARGLVEHFGGMRLYVPARWTEEHDLNVLGEAQAQALCRMFGPATIDIPVVPWTAEAVARWSVELTRARWTKSRIAREIGVSWKRVERARKGAALTPKAAARKVDPRQIDLLDVIGRRERS